MMGKVKLFSSAILTPFSFPGLQLWQETSLERLPEWERLTHKHILSMLLSWINTAAGSAKQFLAGRQKGSEENAQPTNNRNSHLQAVVPAKGRPE